MALYFTTVSDNKLVLTKRISDVFTFVNSNFKPKTRRNAKEESIETKLMDQTGAFFAHKSIFKSGKLKPHHFIYWFYHAGMRFHHIIGSNSETEIKFELN